MIRLYIHFWIYLYRMPPEMWHLLSNYSGCHSCCSGLCRTICVSTTNPCSEFYCGGLGLASQHVFRSAFLFLWVLLLLGLSLTSIWCCLACTHAHAHTHICFSTHVVINLSCEILQSHTCTDCMQSHLSSCMLLTVAWWTVFTLNLGAF